MEGTIFLDVRPGDQDEFPDLIGDGFAFEFHQNHLIAEIGCFLNHQLICEEDGVRYSQYEQPDAPVFVFNSKSKL